MVRLATNKYILGTYMYVDVGGDAAFCVPSWTEQCKNRAAKTKTDTSSLTVVGLTITRHRLYIVDGNRRGSKHSGVEEYLREQEVIHLRILVPW